MSQIVQIVHIARSEGGSLLFFALVFAATFLV